MKRFSKVTPLLPTVAEEETTGSRYSMMNKAIDGQFNSVRNLRRMKRRLFLSYVLDEVHNMDTSNINKDMAINAHHKKAEQAQQDRKGPQQEEAREELELEDIRSAADSLGRLSLKLQNNNSHYHHLNGKRVFKENKNILNS